MRESLANTPAAIIPVTLAPAYGQDKNKKREGGFVIFHHLTASEHTAQLLLTIQVVQTFTQPRPQYINIQVRECV